MLKDNDKLAEIAKGFSNKHRIGMLILLQKTSGLSVSELGDVLGISFRVASEHSRRLTQAGLVNKISSAQQVEHVLTPTGKRVAKFLQELKIKKQ